MKFTIKDLFSKCDQIRRKLQIWSHLLKKFLIENLVIYFIKFDDPKFWPTEKSETVPIVVKFSFLTFFWGLFLITCKQKNT